jgi:hypothetical protein
MRQLPFNIFVSHLKLTNWFYEQWHKLKHINTMIMTHLGVFLRVVTPRVIHNSRKQLFRRRCRALCIKNAILYLNKSTFLNLIVYRKWYQCLFIINREGPSWKVPWSNPCIMNDWHKSWEVLAFSNWVHIWYVLGYANGLPEVSCRVVSCVLCNMSLGLWMCRCWVRQDYQRR